VPSCLEGAVDAIVKPRRSRISVPSRRAYRRSIKSDSPCRIVARVFAVNAPVTHIGNRLSLLETGWGAERKAATLVDNLHLGFSTACQLLQFSSSDRTALGSKSPESVPLGPDDNVPDENPPHPHGWPLRLSSVGKVWKDGLCKPSVETSVAT